MKPVIVMGMWHSGSTYMSKCLVKAGYSMWLSERPDAPFECAEVIRINDGEIARKAKGGRITTRDAMVYQPTPQMRLELANYKNKRRMDGVPWGFKEPRIALLCTAYFQAFRGAKFILCLRNPHRCAMTRYKRKYEGSMLQWLEAYTDIVRFTCMTLRTLPRRQRPDVFVYEQEGNQKVQQESLSRFLDTPIDLVSGYKDMPFDYDAA